MSDQQAELLPCPFCGGEAEYDSNHFCGRGYKGEHFPGYAGSGHAIYCADQTCVGCPSFSSIYETKEEANTAWNRRAAPKSSEGALLDEALAALHARVEALRHDNLDEEGKADELIYAVLAKAGKAQS